MARRTVTLVDARGTPQGEADLLEAHSGRGLLHRAFSVYLFRNDGRELLIQQRSHTKRLWPLVWANTCCSHPLPQEPTCDAGERRLREEMGITCTLTERGTFVYRAEDPAGNGVEYEHLTLLTGNLTDHRPPTPNHEEVHAWKWIDVAALRADMLQHPQRYAPWFHQGFLMLCPEQSDACIS